MSPYGPFSSRSHHSRHCGEGLLVCHNGVQHGVPFLRTIIVIVTVVAQLLATAEALKAAPFSCYIAPRAATPTFLTSSATTAPFLAVRNRNSLTTTTALKALSKSEHARTMDGGSGSVGVFWDVDGTLCDSYRLGFDSTNAVLSRHGCGPIDEAAYHTGTKYTTPRRLAWHVTGDPDHPIGQGLGHEFDALYVDLVDLNTARLYEGMDKLLEYFPAQYPAIKYAALSNACTAYVEAVLRVNGLNKIFSLGLGPDKVPAAKPSPLGLLHCATTLGIPPSRCIYIGDSPTDGHAATAAGMKSIGVTWGSHPETTIRPAFTETVYSVSELQSAIEKFIVDSNVSASL